MNCRSSRRNELERQGVRSAALNDWFGHSGAIAETHYLQTTEADFDLAGDLPGDLFGVPSQGRQDPPRGVTKRKNPGKTGAVVFPDGSGGSIEYTPEDSNL